MNLIEALQSLFQNYFNFTGRASRSEYWLSYLGLLILLFITGIVTLFIFHSEKSFNIIFSILRLVFLVPMLACKVRRMHDTNHSGWFLLIPVYNFILLVSSGDSDENTYGEEPF